MGTHQLSQGSRPAFRGLRPSRPQTAQKRWLTLYQTCLLIPASSTHPPAELQDLGSDYSALILQNLGSR